MEQSKNEKIFFLKSKPLSFIQRRNEEKNEY